MERSFNECQELARTWAENPYYDVEYRKQILSLLEESKDLQQPSELYESFYKNLEFGTGGMRGMMGVGPNRIGRYTIRQATQALALTLLENFSQEKQIKVLVSYDSRINSKEFAMETAQVMAANGIYCEIFSELTPVPILSFSVKKFSFHAGVMITASHNPKIYNGYKIYQNTGAQIAPPLDQKVMDKFLELADHTKIPFISHDEAHQKGLIKNAPTAYFTEYKKMVIENAINKDLIKEKGSDLKIVYSPIHGTGLAPLKILLTDLGFKSLSIVEEQANPDGNFPTVKFPNPEEKEAMQMAEDLLIKNQASIALATDPDSDRMGVIVRHEEKIYYLNGNQIAIILLHYILEQKKSHNILPPNPFIFKTIVTSPLQDQIAKFYGAKVINTLTGFKWMGNIMAQQEKEGILDGFVFGSEESFGQLTQPHVRDKDGLSSITMMCEAALYHLSKNMTLIDALDEIYNKFGLSFEKNIAFNYSGIEGKKKIERIMEHFRHWEKSQMVGETITQVEDYQKSIVYNHEVKKESALDLPKSNVLGLHYSSGNQLYMRPSGTEPKIKFYIMIQEFDGTLEEKKKKASEKAHAFDKFIQEEIKGI